MSWLFDPSGLTPHGFCLLWEPGLIWTYATTDIVIGITYLAIPIALGTLVRKRRDLMFRQVFLLFAAFISLCGVSHLLDALTLWVPAYWLLALVKSAAAIVSLLTAIAVWRLMPVALRFPSNAQVRAQERELDRARAAAATHQRLIDMVKVAAVMLREIDGTIQFWSEGCERLYGWSAGEAIGRLSHDLLRTIFPASLADIEATIQLDGCWTGELHHRTRDNATVIVLVTMTLLDDVEGADRLVVETSTDVSALRAAQTELQQSEAQLASLVDTAADGVVVAGSDGQIRSVNPAMLAMFGYDRAADVIGQNLRLLMPLAEAMRHDSYIVAHRAGARPRVIGVPGRELLAVRRDGTAFPIDLSVSSFGFDGSRLLTGIIRDASVRKQSEMALSASEARLRLVQQVGGIAYSDRALSEPATLISEEFAQLYGLQPARRSITNEEWVTSLHPEDRDRVSAERTKLLQHGGTLTTEFRIFRLDGALRWIIMRCEVFADADGRPNRVIGAQQDITELVAGREALAVRQHELEERVAERTAALAKAEARFRGIFDSQFQFINLLALDGSVLEANRTALDAGGLMLSEVVGQPLWQTAWWPMHERDQLREEIAQAARGFASRRETELNGARGLPIWVDFSLTPARDPMTGEVTGIIAEGRDLTERRALANQLLQAQKMQALGQLSGGIAHDFNNILQAVSVAASLIADQVKDREPTRELAAKIVATSERGASITQRLLSFARQGDLRAEALSTADLLREMREVLAHTLGTTITVLATVPSDIPALIADRAQLETALINLSSNARDAMPGGGTLTLSAEPEHVGENDRHPADLEPGDYVRLDIADTGSGMDAATLRRVSEPFFTTKPVGHGTGLGVPMARGFAEQSGGALSIVSTPGVGTTATMWLRQAGIAPAGFAYDKPQSPAVARGPARILVVDDDDIVREMLAVSLEAAGFGVLVASRGLEAIALIETGETVDAMVSDLSMPGINGVTTILKVRALRPRLPCFLLTGHAGEIAHLAAENTFTVLRKPISRPELVANIEASLVSAGP